VLATIISEVKQPAVAPIGFDVSSKRGTIKIGEVIENRFGPLQNPVTGAEVAIQVRIPNGMEYSDQGEADILRSETMRSGDEISFDHTGCHTSFVEHQTFSSHR
jgi:hypothetical protein